MRYVYSNKCLWEDNWKKGNFDIPNSYISNFEGFIKYFFLNINEA